MGHRKRHFMGLLGVLLLVAVVVSWTRSNQVPYRPSEADRAAVIDAFLRSRGEGAVVEEDLAPNSHLQDSALEMAQELGIPDARRQLLERADLPSGLTAVKKIMTAEDGGKLESSGKDFWSAFYATYGEPSYLATLSPLAFSADGKTCIFIASCYRGGLAGEVGLAHLRLGSEGWSVVDFEVLMVS